VIFWSTNYGKQSNPDNLTSLGSGDYKLPLSDMKEYAEKCYDVYVNDLGFYFDDTKKIIILAYYSTDWIATGSGYGDYGLLNIAHSSVNGDYYTYCHEIAHAYQYLGNNKYGGNAGFQYGDYYGYVSYYECSANWQAGQIYPNKYFSQTAPIYQRTTNLHFIHPWHCYQSYLMNDYWTEKQETTTVGQIWTKNTNVKYADPVEKYMTIYGVDAEQVYKDFFFAAMRFVTYDLDRFDNYLAEEGKSRDTYMWHQPGTQACANTAPSDPTTSYDKMYWNTQSFYQYVTTDASNAIHQVAYSSAPQSTGYNVIQLNIPTDDDRTITTKFTALSPGASLASGDKKEYWKGDMWVKISATTYNTSQTDECNSTYDTFKNWRGFRLGYVTYKKSTGERKYNYVDQVFCTGTDESSVNFQFEVPEDIDSLYLVVSPALSNYLRMGSFNPYECTTSTTIPKVQKQYDQWPYRVQFYNTNIYGLSVTPDAYTGTDVVTGDTYTTSQLPDLTKETKSYTIKLADGSPAGAGYTVSDELTSIGNDQYTTTKTITSSNVSNLVQATKVDGYKAKITIDDTTITITYEASQPMANVTFTWDVSIPVDASDYTGTSISLSDDDISQLCQAFQVDALSDVVSALTAYSASQSNGTAMFYAANADGSLQASGSTANGYGHWFNESGAVVSWGDKSDAFSEATISSDAITFSIGQYPDHNSEGDSYTIRQAIKYIDSDGESAIAYFVFNLTFVSSSSTATSTEQDPVYEFVKASAMLPIGGYYYGTCYVNFDADIYSPSGATAYAATSIDTENALVTLKPLSGYIPAGTGVVLRYTEPCNSTIYLTTATSASAADTDGNLLIGTVASPYEIFSDDGYFYFILTMSSEGKGGFLYQNTAYWSGTSIASNDEGTAVICYPYKAALRVGEKVFSSETGAKALSIVIDDGESTGIALANVATATGCATYDLTGRRVSAPVKRGIYIRNGKKFIVK